MFEIRQLAISFLDLGTESEKATKECWKSYHPWIEVGTGHRELVESHGLPFYQITMSKRVGGREASVVPGTNKGSDGRRVESRMTGVAGREPRVLSMRFVETRFDESWVVAR